VKKDVNSSSQAWQLEPPLDHLDGLMWVSQSITKVDKDKRHMHRVAMLDGKEFLSGMAINE
jgi:hypothetical protein